MDKIKIVGIIYGSSRLTEFNSAITMLKKENINIDVMIYDVSEINMDIRIYDDLISDLKDTKAVFLSFHGSCSHMYNFFNLTKELENKYVYYSGSIDDEFIEFRKNSKLNKREVLELSKYFKQAGKENAKEFLKILSNYAYNTDLKVNKIFNSVKKGIYYKNSMLSGKEADEFIEKQVNSGKNVIGVLLHEPYLTISNIAHVDAIIDRLEELGVAPICAFARLARDGENGIIDYIKDVYIRDGKVIVDTIISTLGYSLSTYYKKDKEYVSTIFECFDVPVIQAISVYLSDKEFEESKSGIDIASLSINVYQPEMDGQIISVPVAVTNKVAINGSITKKYVPIPDRIDMVANLANRFSKLKNKKNEDKKIALILHNYPPRNDMIGSAYGLDTPQSLYNLLTFLKENSYNLDLNFKDGADIINELIKRGSNDWRFTETNVIKTGKVGEFDRQRFKKYFKFLPEFNVKDMKRKWGDPIGKTMVLDDEIIVPGIIDNNIFIGMQPIRSNKDDVEEDYHSVHNPPPYSYLAFYKWIDEIFKADAIIHIGTHGTLEWLPGKEVALSKESYPDLNISSMPHLYIYNLGILGEGMQTRRRSHSVVLSHLIPAMQNAGVYDYLESLEELMEKYDHAIKSSPAQVESLLNQIIKVARANNILKDLKIENISKNEYHDTVTKIHNWIHAIKNKVIMDGLHIYGDIPKNERFLNMVKGLSSLEQEGVMSLSDAIIIALNENPEKITEELLNDELDNTKNYKIYEMADDISNKIIKKLNDLNFNKKCITDKFINKFIKSGNTNELLATLKFICTEIVPALKGCIKEKTSFIDGLNSKMVEPSLGGNPTRGNIRLLPTGRNFYSINPEEVPSKSAYKIGSMLGKQQLDTYFKENGSYPTNIAIVVYATNTMKTYGEDLGEIFYLMGVEPVYLSDTKTVIGIKAIPVEKLGRPRVDVTLRISGLFRDSFPNLIQLMDDAVSCVAFLDEPDELNPIKKNIHDEIQRLSKEGLSSSEAFERASVRVFGAPACDYGAGVNNLIESKDWENISDLADEYMLWSSHAYSRKFHGEFLKDEFNNILSKTTLTIKNEVSNEIDILDADDFYNYHGGLIAAVKNASNKTPESYVGNTANPKFLQSRDLKKETALVVRSKVLNPAWISGMKKHGYKGAQDISKNIDIMFGWDATADNIEDWMYDGVAERFLFDEETYNWMKSVNKSAVYQISERLLEANQRGMWNASEQDINKLKQIYLNSEGDLEKN